MYFHNLGMGDEELCNLIENGHFKDAIAKTKENKLIIDLSTNTITSEAAIKLIKHLVSVNDKPITIELDLSNNDITANPELWQLLNDTCHLPATEYSANDSNLEQQVYSMIAADPVSINILENPISCFRLHQMKKNRIR